MRIEIFRTGTHTAGSGQTVSYSEDDVRAIAATYDPALREAPFVVGHPSTDAPAYGWVTSLTAEADGLLIVTGAEKVHPEFAEIVNDGRFKYVSVSLYLPGHPAHPLGEHAEAPYLKHVGFLGAAAPAVKGLQAASFAEPDAEHELTLRFSADEAIADFELRAYTLGQFTRLFRRMRDVFVERFGAEDAERALPTEELGWIDESLAYERAEEIADDRKTTRYSADPGEADPTPTDPPGPMPKTVEQLEAELAEARSQNETVTSERDAAAQRAAEFTTRDRRTAIDTFLAPLEARGSVLPKDRPRLAAVLDHLEAGDAAEVTFADGDGTATASPASVLREVLAGLPSQIDYAERASDRDAAQPLDFSDPTVVADAITGHIEAAAKAGRTVSPASALAEIKRNRSAA